MIADILSRKVVEEASGLVHAQLEAEVPRAEMMLTLADDPDVPVDRETAPNALATLAASVPALDEVDHGDGSFVARDPFRSLVQTELERKIRRDHPELLTGPSDDAIGATHALRESINFTTADWVRWGVECGEAIARRLLRGPHPFNDAPAEVALEDDARVIVVGDWGSGLQRARDVAACMREEMLNALAADRPVHVVHLGDVYYSGEDEEYQRHVLDPDLWPVRPEDAARGVKSWSLNGNHDMYSGGEGYFKVLLGDERFKAQRSPDGRKPTSWFRLRGRSWDIVGLDTAWTKNRLSLGQAAELRNPQAKFVEEVASEGRHLMLLSHHQPISAHEHAGAEEVLGRVLWDKLGNTIRGGSVDAWLWGHEHTCMAFDPGPIPFARCIGHGGVPVKRRPPKEYANVAWEYDGYLQDGDTRWARFGFAVLDPVAGGDSIEVRYRNDRGDPEPAPETIEPA